MAKSLLPLIEIICFTSYYSKLETLNRQHLFEDVKVLRIRTAAQLLNIFASNILIPPLPPLPASPSPPLAGGGRQQFGNFQSVQ
jgi:hypothetical protein